MYNIHIIRVPRYKYVSLEVVALVQSHTYQVYILYEVHKTYEVLRTYFLYHTSKCVRTYRTYRYMLRIVQLLQLVAHQSGQGIEAFSARQQY